MLSPRTSPTCCPNCAYLPKADEITEVVLQLMWCEMKISVLEHRLAQFERVEESWQVYGRKLRPRPEALANARRLRPVPIHLTAYAKPRAQWPPKPSVMPPVLP